MVGPETIALPELPAYFRAFATPISGQKVECVRPAAQQVLVNVNLVVPILGWPLSNRKGIFIVKLVGTIRLLNALWLTPRGVPVNNMETEPLALCIRCPKLVNEVLARRQVFPSRVIVVLAATLVLPTVLTACIALPTNVIPRLAISIRWLSTNKEQQVPVTLLTNRECIVRRQVPSRKQEVPRL